MADEPEQKWWHSEARPFWWPDAQGFVIAAIVVYVGVSLNYRMRYPSDVNDKLLDMMLTILFGTAFVGIVNYLVGSSRGSAAKDDVLNKLAATPVAPVAPVAVVAPIAPIAPIAPNAPATTTITTVPTEPSTTPTTTTVTKEEPKP
jgi:hypothetical protein